MGMFFKFIDDVFDEWSVFSWFCKESFYKILRFLRILFRNFRHVWLFIQDFLFYSYNCIFWLFISLTKWLSKRILKGTHVVQQNAKSPSVILSSSWLPFELLRRSYRECTLNSLLIWSNALVKHSWLSKVSNLDILTIMKHDVLRLKIIMYNIHPVQIAYSSTYLLEVDPDFPFRERRSFLNFFIDSCLKSSFTFF